MGIVKRAGSQEPTEHVREDVTGGRVLVVDDQELVVRNLGRMLSRVGHSVTTCTSGREAARRVLAGGYEVVVADIQMPDLNGLALLERIRRADPDLPVILVTGRPDIETAIRAVDSGASRYLRKPVGVEPLRRSVTDALGRYRRSRALRRAQGPQREEHAAAEHLFAQALSGLWMAYQPIVCVRRCRPVGYEALLRTPELGPLELLELAEALARLPEIARAVQAATASTWASHPTRGDLFLNIHPRDLRSDALLRPGNPLEGLEPRVVLEITERASIEQVPGFLDRLAGLRSRGFRVAIDDLGAGHSGLKAVTTVRPDYVKLDRSLVTGVERSPMRQSLVRRMTEFCHENAMVVVAEGVETPAERDALCGIGVDLLQGFWFARPGRPFPPTRW